MKYSINTYRLYNDEKRFSSVIRARVTLKDVLDELGIAYKVEGPFPKHLSKHVLP